MSKLQPGKWALLIVGSRQNQALLHAIFGAWKHVHFHAIGAENTEDVSWGEANQFRFSQQFRRQLEDIGSRNFLIFETDSFLLQPGIEDWLGEYALIGPPWCASVVEEKTSWCCNGGLMLQT
eukprot:TRINITY_DN93875_c0_g1_i1.p1 TRINITY_DN93875_c0_g1~~TRINITY_DN93875_c0_g1_i1.p1  ORF type:complete len:122 (+),score=17.55 TRINITY_DN93875_c0_g1_i1:299-664(+)